MKTFVVTAFLIFLVLKYFFLNLFKIELSNILSLISILVDIVVPLTIAYFLQNKFLKNRDIKSYYIKQIESLIADYDSFLKNLKRGLLNRSDITNEFQNFSIRFLFIESKLESKFAIKDKVQNINRDLQIIITDSKEFNSAKTSSKVKLNGKSTTELNKKLNLILEYGSEVISKLQQ